MFKVGDRVVCVDDSPGYANRDPHGLVAGRVYTVSFVGTIHPGIDVLEAPAYICEREVDLYHIRRFRKVQDQSITSELVEQFKEGYVEECPEYVPQTQEA